MALPRAVIEAEKRADELLAQRSTATNVEQSDGEVTANGQQPEYGVNPQAERETESQTTAAPLAEEDPSWEQRYRSLTGKYNAEVPRLAAANRELTAKLQSIEQEIESLRTAKQTPRESLVKKEEVEEFGEPLVDLIRRAAREEMSDKDSVIESLKAKLDRFEASNVRTIEVDFYERLASSVPDWEEMNKDRGFLDWLAEYDELTGKQRQDSLDDAVSMKDASRAARFFNKWKDMSQKKAATATRSLESQVVPATGTVSTPPPGKKIWTRTEISDFYGKARRGEISDKQMVAIEADIHAAQLENRIR